jgi:hypothetical protein
LPAGGTVFGAALPFGGYKESGWGREMGHEAMRLYTETKAVVIGLRAAAAAAKGDCCRRYCMRQTMRALSRS